MIFNEPLEKSPETLPSSTKNKNDSKQYVGIYRFGPAFKVNVYLQHGALYAASDESEGSELICIGTDSFFNRNLYAKVKFEKNEQGNISRMKWQPLGATEGFYGNKE